ncbi:hypothetical protein BD413DRAFT_546025 [Trametes elegans]|nr:hypothetical protein BD413DRAFT_546025 [Trametes elegans]
MQRFWGPRFRVSVPSILFFLNRYLAVLGHLPVLVFVSFFPGSPAVRSHFYCGTITCSNVCALTTDVSISPEVESLHVLTYLARCASCLPLGKYYQQLTGILQFTVGGLQLVRTYALYNRSRWVLSALMGLYGLAFVVAVWATCTAWASPTPKIPTDGLAGGHCTLGLSQAYEKYLVGVWAAVPLFDGVILAFTLSRVFSVYREWRGGLFALLWRDSIAYFVVLFVCHLLNIVTTLVSTPAYRGISVPVINAISSCMITRLMLNIRDPDLGRIQEEL